MRQQFGAFWRVEDRRPYMMLFRFLCFPDLLVLFLDELGHPVECQHASLKNIEHTKAHVLGALQLLLELPSVGDGLRMFLLKQHEPSLVRFRKPLARQGCLEVPSKGKTIRRQRRSGREGDRPRENSPNVTLALQHPLALTNPIALERDFLHQETVDLIAKTRVSAEKARREKGARGHTPGSSASSKYRPLSEQPHVTVRPPWQGRRVRQRRTRGGP